MARITPLHEVADLEADQYIIAIKGKLKNLFPAKTGTSEHGPWSMQHGVLTDGKTEIGITFKDRDEISQKWRNREVLIECTKGSKGWNGVYAWDDTFVPKGKEDTGPKRKIKVTKTAEVSLYEETPDERAPSDPPPHHEESAPPPRAEHREQTQQQQHAPPPAPATTNGGHTKPPTRMSEVLEAATQVANLQLLCLHTVQDYVVPRFKEKAGHDMDAMSQHAWAMNICIQLERINAHTQMPKTRFVTRTKEDGSKTTEHHQPTGPQFNPATGEFEF